MLRHLQYLLCIPAVLLFLVVPLGRAVQVGRGLRLCLVDLGHQPPRVVPYRRVNLLAPLLLEDLVYREIRVDPENENGHLWLFPVYLIFSKYVFKNTYVYS